MQRILRGMCVGTAFLGLTLAAAEAQSNSSTSGSAMASAPAASKNESFCGTVVKLTEANCIGVKSSTITGQRVYEITSANPKPKVGALITGSGTPGGVSMCMEGTHLNDVKWQKAAACPLGHNIGN